MERIKKGEILKEEIKEERKDQYAGIIKDGVEVVDVKAIPLKPEMDKYGIPVTKSRKTWDKLN